MKEIYEERTETKIAKGETETFIDDVYYAIECVLAEGNDVPLGKLGYLTVKERSARKGRNPQTGEEIDISASKNVGFKVGKHLKDLLNNK
ncbi:HU family DNA-binding protein [Butyricicoccus sp. 1XD8-22]|nr:HU family DNA-binding protein [Butyricicoccus sp. 1XD8-22]